MGVPNHICFTKNRKDEEKIGPGGVPEKHFHLLTILCKSGRFWRCRIRKVKPWLQPQLDNTFSVIFEKPKKLYAIKKWGKSVRKIVPREQKNIRYPKITKYTEISAPIVEITPKEGDLLIFPAYLYHAVSENLAEEDRIIVSFNVDIKYR